MTFRGLMMLAAVAVVAAAGTTAAQSPSPPPGPLAQPSSDPRDFNGVWLVPGYDYRFVPADGSTTPWLPWAKAEFDKRQKAQAEGKPIVDSTALCLPSGIPRVMAAPYPIKFIQTPREIIMLLEVQHLYRIIYMNEAHPEDLEPTYMGHSVGHWEGDTLVVDTAGNTTQTLLDEAGDPHSEKLHVIERYRKIDGGKRLENRITIDDPGAYSKPWTAVRNYNWRPEIRIMEYICEENNRNVTDSAGTVGVELNATVKPR